MKRIQTMTAVGALLALAVPSAANAEVVMGLAIGITGECAAIGEQARLGAETAVADINAAGGINGEQVRIELGDDACDPKQAVAVANQFVTRGVDFVVGHLYSGATIAASDVYAEEDILMISGSATAPALTERGLPYVFRGAGRDDQQGTVAAELIAEQHADKKVAVLHDKGAYGKGLADEVEKTLKEKGITPAVTDSITAGEQDYSAVVSKLKTAGVEVIYYGGYYPEAGLLLRQAREQSYSPLIIGADGLQATDLWAIAGDAATGTLFTFSPDPSQIPAAQPLLTRLKEQGAQPDNFAFNYYATVQAVAEAANIAGTTDAEAVAAALRSNEFDTVIGTLSFDEKGDLTNPDYVIYEWRDGQSQVLN